MRYNLLIKRKDQSFYNILDIEERAVRRLFNLLQDKAKTAHFEGQELTLEKISSVKAFSIENRGELERRIGNPGEHRPGAVWRTGSNILPESVLEEIGKHQTYKFFPSEGISAIEDKMEIESIPIFLSHSSKNKDLVQEFIEHILVRSIGLNEANDIFCTSTVGTGIKTGREWRTEILSKLKESKVVIFIITPEFLQSPMCMHEVGAAWALGKQIFGLHVPGIPLEAFGPFLPLFQMKNLKESDDLDDFRDDIQDDLEMKNLNFRTSQWTKQKKIFLEKIGSLESESNSISRLTEKKKLPPPPRNYPIARKKEDDVLIKGLDSSSFCNFREAEKGIAFPLNFPKGYISPNYLCVWFQQVGLLNIVSFNNSVSSLDLDLWVENPNYNQTENEPVFQVGLHDFDGNGVPFMVVARRILGLELRVVIYRYFPPGIPSDSHRIENWEKVLETDGQHHGIVDGPSLTLPFGSVGLYFEYTWVKDKFFRNGSP